MRITECKVNHIENPVGFRMPRTVFSWKVVEAEGKRQDCARILVALDPQMTEVLHDTGFTGEADSLGTRIELPLSPRTRYFWQVTVRTDAGEEKTGAVQFFETGKADEPWTGRFISCDSKEPRHPFFEKQVRPSGPVSDARLYLCGLGLYEAYFVTEEGGAVKIGDEFLTPYSNDYNRWVQAETFDVTGALRGVRSGESIRLSVLLGNGWYKGRFGFAAREEKGYYGNEWKLIAELHLRYEDGTEEVIGTDESWTVRRSQISYSSLYDGEHLDRTLPALPEEKAFFCEPPRGRLTDRMSLPVRARENFIAAEIIHTPEGGLVLDMGQNFAGIFTLRVKEPAGTKVRVRFCEALQDGNFYNKNLRSAKAEYLYTADGREEILRPHFTYYGYRYVQIDGIPALSPQDFTGIALYSEIDMTGDIRTGHALLNQLISNIRWGMKGNFIDVPTDCPQRDERMGWTADTQVFAPTALYLSDAYAFYAKYLHDLYEEQQEADGKVPDVVPSAGVDSCSSVWGDAATFIPWSLYQTYGDRSILEDQYDSMKQWVEYVRRLDGTDHHWREVFHYGDWLALDHPSGSVSEVRGGTDNGYIANIYYAVSAGILADSAAILGETEDSEEYRRLSQKELDEVRREYFSETGRSCQQTQTACLLALKYDLSRDPERIRELLQELFRYSRGKLKTGFVGTPILCNVLSDNGMSRLAYDILLNEDYPGWLHEVRLGATTVWERWNSLDDQLHFTSLDMNSLNHYAEGSVLEWIFSHAAGLRALEPGYRRALIQPEPDPRLGHLACSYDSPAGRYQIEWSLSGGAERVATAGVTEVFREKLSGEAEEIEFRLDVEIPFGCEARLVLPGSPETASMNGRPVSGSEALSLLPGHYTFVYSAAGMFSHGADIDTPICELLELPGLFERIPALSGLSHIPPMFENYSIRQMAGQFPDQFGAGRLEEINQLLKTL